MSDQGGSADGVDSVDRFLPVPHLPFYVLVALSEAPRHGWGVVQRIAELSGGRVEPSTGSLYLAIRRLTESALIEQTEAPQDDEGESPHEGRRRYYQLTELGGRVLGAERLRLESLLEVAREWRSADSADGGGLP